MTVRILVGDVRERLADLPDRSVHCVITSPPYFGLRDYGVKGQRGLEDKVERFIDNLVKDFRAVKRVLRDDGTLWLNIGDSYQSDGGKREANVQANGTLAHRGACNFRIPSNPRGTEDERIKNKDLLGVPWMLAFALRADGWYLRSDIIWHKPNPMPESVRDRPTRAHEYLFLLSKKERYYYDDIAIREPAGRASDKKPTSVPWTDNGLGRAKRDVWTISTQGFPGAHFATFPAKLVEPCILAGTSKEVCKHCGSPYQRVIERKPIDRTELPPDHPEYRPRQYESKYDDLPDHLMGGSRGKYVAVETIAWTLPCFHKGDEGMKYPDGKAVVLDPFGGAGTTALVAERLGRDSILVELKEDYARMAQERINSEQQLFAPARIG